MTVVQVDGHRIPGYLRQELLFDMLAMAGLSTDREPPQLWALGSLQRTFALSTATFMSPQGLVCLLH